MKIVDAMSHSVSFGTAAQWAATNRPIEQGVLCVESDTGRAKVGNGVDLYSQLEYGFNNITDEMMLRMTYPNQAGGFYLTGQDSQVAASYFPDEVKNAPVFVADIAARNALPADQRDAVIVVVADASADELVSSGMAWYLWDSTSEVWRILHKQEQVVLEFPEEVMPSTATLDEFGDGAIYGRVTHDQLTLIDTALLETDEIDLDVLGPENWIKLPPVWSTPNDPGEANGGVPYSLNLQATDPYSGAITYTVLDVLPDGLSLVGNQITGIPTNQPSTVVFTVRASSAVAFADRTFTLTITNQTPIWSTPAGLLWDNYVGQPLSITLVATDPNMDTVSFRLASGSTLPAGVTLTGNTLSGPPTNIGTFNFTIEAYDSLGATVARTFTIISASNTTAALLHLNGTLTDDSKYHASVSGTNVIFSGDAVTMTTTSQIVIPWNADFNFGTGDYTIEMIFSQNADNMSGYVIPCSSKNLKVGFQLDAGGMYVYYLDTGWYDYVSFVRTAGTRYHVALVRAGGMSSAYINGNRVLNVAYAGSISIPVGNHFYLGYNPSYPARAFSGQIHEFKISRSALYTGASFTPPSLTEPLSP